MSWHDGSSGQLKPRYGAQSSALTQLFRCAMVPMQSLLGASEYTSSKRPDFRGHHANNLVSRLERLTQAAKELSEATGRTCIPAQGDVRDPKTLQEAVAKTIEKFGRIDFVICGEGLSNKT
jgi:hypothetical protein